MPIVVLRPTAGEAPAPSTTGLPTVSAEVAYATSPAASFPVYTDVTAYLRDMACGRGRNYEYDRAETGTAAFTLSNRDSRFNPENTSSPYYPNLKPTRRCRLRATWDGTIHELFVGFTKGYPQEFPAMGYDAVVRQRASDLFYRLNMTKFQPGSTTLTSAIGAPEQAVDATGAPIVVEIIESITVAGTALPMPQAVPFTVTIGEEDMLVTAVDGLYGYTVKRAQNETSVSTHEVGAPVTTLEASFGEELSGTRIGHVLDRIGLIRNDYQLDPGQSVIAASENLAGQNMLAHVQEIAEAENGRLFVSKSGTFTFHDRHWSLSNERTDRATFSDGGVVLNAIPYVLSGPVEHDESLIANVVRITPDSGNTQTASDQTSIDENFERVLEKQWPLASDVEAKSAAEWMIFTLKDATVRIPSLTLNGKANPTGMWPTLLGMEIGQRYGFTYTPRGGGTTIARSVVVEGVSHSAMPGNHQVTVQLSPAVTTNYWRLGLAGYGELGVATRLVY